MDTASILTELRRERERLTKAIDALASLDQPANVVTMPKRRGRRTMSAAARARISRMMKARWAERRKAAA